MPSKRVPLTKSKKEEILREFNHRCAICGKERPHIHHIDEDPSNNLAENLLPLCPNCHLIDQHNPTAPIDPKKLSLFRQYKDPSILAPEFDPIFKRMDFLNADMQKYEVNNLSTCSEELVAFLSELEMGTFYAKKVKALLKQPSVMEVYGLMGDISPEKKVDWESEYLRKIDLARDPVRSLVIEMLRYQKWAKKRRDI